MDRTKRNPRQYYNPNIHPSFHSQQQQHNTYRPDSHSYPSSTHNNQRPSIARKRRFETYNQSTNDPSHLNGPPAFKRARFNHYNQNLHPNTRHTYNQNQNPNRNSKFRQQQPYPPNANAHGNRNYVTNKGKPPKKKEMEQDFHRITQRMRQIDFGKATDEYKNYIALIPKDKRQCGHPHTPNPRYKMPNKHWKTAVNRWRKALHAFDDIGEKKKNDARKEEQALPTYNTLNPFISQESPQKDVESTDGNFCCEKCYQEFAKFDEWQNHREKCNGKTKEKINEKENVEPKESEKKEEEEEEDEDDDLFKLDEDIDLSLMQSTSTKETEETREATLLMALNDVLNEDDDELF